MNKKLLFLTILLAGSTILGILSLPITLDLLGKAVVVSIFPAIVVLIISAFIGYIEKDKNFLVILALAMLSFTIVFTEENRSRRNKVKAKYPSLSIVGIFLNRFNNDHLIAINLVFVTLAAYLALVFIFPLVGIVSALRREVLPFLIAYIVILGLQRLVINYRVKKGFYLNNENETRELIDFIKANSDDIDFTGNNKIISSRDLEDIVLEGMRHIPAN